MSDRDHPAARGAHPGVAQPGDAVAAVSSGAAADPLAPLKACELHVHLGGCFAVDDLIDLARPYMGDIDWSHFVDTYTAAYGPAPDPVALIEAAGDGNAAAVDAVRRHYVFTGDEGPDFARFQAKFNFFIAVARHYLGHVEGGEREIPRRAFARLRADGLRYAEVRANYMKEDDPEGFGRFHRLNIEAARQACDAGFTARFVPSLPRAAPLPTYLQLRALLDADPDLYEHVPGIDFCYVEEGFPPRTTADFFRRLERDNDADPGRALEVLYHVGEIYFDKSVESAVRWCHQAAELGARRLGHCTALGLDPAAAVARRGGAHAREPVCERLDQIAYDLQHRQGLEDAGVEVHPQALRAEADQLRRRDPDGLLHRPYDEARLEQARRRQAFALAQIARLGAIIESCPSSNLRLGSVPTPEAHPVHRFLAADVDLVIGADDPGIFDAPLSAEVDWVVATTHLSPRALYERLGDPLRHRLGRLRPGFTPEGPP